MSIVGYVNCFLIISLQALVSYRNGGSANIKIKMLTLVLRCIVIYMLKLRSMMLDMVRIIELRMSLERVMLVVVLLGLKYPSKLTDLN